MLLLGSIIPVIADANSDLEKATVSFENANAATINVTPDEGGDGI